MLGSVMDAEDIVQEAFLSYERLQDADAIRNERAYLYKIVTNRCLDLLRSSVKKGSCTSAPGSRSLSLRGGFGWRFGWRSLRHVFALRVDFHGLPIAVAAAECDGTGGFSPAGDFPVFV